MSGKKYYSPEMLACADTADLKGLADAGEIDAAQLVTARFRQLSPWRGDKISVQARQLVKQDDGGTVRAEVEAMREIIARAQNIERKLGG